jgi:long-subunit acyl-CoA synthetase (AMP-forming)
MALRHATLCEAFQETSTRCADQVALRTPSDAVRVTWRDYAARVRRVATGLAATGVRRGDSVALMMTNRPEFNVCDAAAMHLGATGFSVYNTLPQDEIRYLFANARACVAFCERQFLSKVSAAAEGTGVRTVVCVDGGGDGVLSLDALEAKDAPGFDFDATWHGVKPEDVLTLIYTSGTTGRPKGVELTHANMLAQIDAVNSILPANEGDRIVSYLPSAHVADRWSAHYLPMVFGVTVTSVSDARTIGRALADTRPTIWGGVPRVWEKLKAGLGAAFAMEKDEAKKKAVQWALAVGLKRARAEQAALRGEGDGPDDALRAEHAKAEALVLSAIRQRLGFDRLRWACSGAAPIAVEVLEHFAAIGVPIAELWGMSELSCCATINPLDRILMGTVGRALPGVELKLAPDGELLARGPTVMKGYRDEPEKTAETIDADGWLATGDIAEIDAEGYVKIVDRKKELIIGAGGKNMSPANIENAIKSAHPLIGQAVCIGDRRPYNVALLVLDPDGAVAHAAAHGLEPSPSALSTHPSVRGVIEAAIRAANERLSRVEQIKRFAILPAQWEPGGEELTPTMKLKRKAIGAKYAEEIERLYADEGGPKTP